MVSLSKLKKDFDIFNEINLVTFYLINLNNRIYWIKL